MFQEWNFLLVEIWVLLALAALVGLIAGWLIWGGRVDAGADADEIRRLQTEVDHQKARVRSLISDPVDDLPPMQGGGYLRPKLTIPLTPTPAPIAATGKPKLETDNGTKPQGLDAARNGLPDDLTKIKGIGPIMEKLCNRSGIWHFDQIASWSADEIAWVDADLEGFKGRVSRDDWVAQAKDLAANQTPGFVRHKD